MLVLARRKGEVIVIGDDIRIKVTRVLRDRVFLGITAPRGVRVDRAESLGASRAEGNHAFASEQLPGLEP